MKEFLLKLEGGHPFPASPLFRLLEADDGF